MEARDRLVAQTSLAGVRVDLPAVAAWLLPFAAILYLGLNNGGYDLIERSEVGIVLSLLLVVGTAVGAIAVPARSRSEVALQALLWLFAAWTLTALLWTGDSERTVAEIARVATYACLFTVLLAVQGGGRWRHVLNGVTAGVGVIGAVAVLSRLEPNLFPELPTAEVFPGLESRLAYPLNYTSGMGAFAAIGLPLLLGAAWSARSLLMGALAMAAFPVCALALWLTASGLSVPIAAVAVVAYLALAPDRLPKLGSLLAGGAGSAMLFAAVNQRDALDLNLGNAEALRQGDEMLAIVLFVCAGVALLHTALRVAATRLERPGWASVSERGARRVALGLVGAAACALLIAVASGAAGDAWDEFKSSDDSGDASRGSQLLDISSGGRYDFWGSAVDVGGENVLTGIGPGTFEFWWAQEGDHNEFVRDAHSLYFETFAELGLIGVLLIAGFSIAVIAMGAARALRAPTELRAGLAAATAGAVAFVGAASIDWMWELAVMPAVFLALAAIIAAGGREPDPAARAPGAARWVLVALAAGALIANGIVYAGADALDRSREQARAGELTAALGSARQAKSIQPYASDPRLQEALVLERMGRLDEAAAAARDAARRAPESWRPWLVIARVEARNGNAPAAVDAYRHGRELAPRSGFFAQ